ncbi:uncharacterized protein BDV14DRAFT_198940 [Aspergillus stella-maris]|uniref:uncharacterized protein n=1 Tax=Aspergillus stella-maris TaxID=1810926 RepID=UPI003CCCB3E2
MSDRPQVAFISGPVDTGPDFIYFKTHYITPLQSAISKGHNFIIGPIPSGVDADALDYLLCYPIDAKRITIFMTPGENTAFGTWFRAKGVNTHVLPDVTATSGMRDAAMTEASDYDILHFRTDEEGREFYGKMYREGVVTNTERNWRRRRGLT